MFRSREGSSTFVTKAGKENRVKAETHQTRRGKDFKNILTYCVTDG